MARRARLLAIGDIHGCRAALRKLLTAVAPTRRDRIVFLGDYIDRGPDPRGVVDTLLMLRRRLPRCVFLMGNHERMLLNALAGKDRPLYLYNGGDVTLRAYTEAGHVRLPAAHRRFFEGLLLYYETAGFIFVHAGLRPGRPLRQQNADDLLWIREAFLQASADWEKTVVFGHTPMREPFFGRRRIGLDTGAVCGGALTACDLHTRRIWQARRED